MARRILKEIVCLEHKFTREERERMGLDLAGAYMQRENLINKEKVVKAQFSEKQKQIDSDITTLSQNLTVGFEMRDVDCILVWDSPNVGEITYKRKDTGEVVKTRAMTDEERQMDLPLEDMDATLQSIAESSANAEEFFKEKPEKEEGDLPEEEGEETS